MKHSHDALSLAEKEYAIDHKQASLAETYNDTVCLLTSLPNEKLIDIFSFCLVDNVNKVKSLEKSIKGFMQMNTVCRNFNRLLTFETIGEFCESYAQENKDQALINLKKELKKIDNNRLRILILLHAGANVNTNEGDYLILYSTLENNSGLNKILFRYHANPNAKIRGMGPVFFFAETIAMAHTFINSNNFNIHAFSDYRETNVLWKMTQDDYPSELMRLYLAYGVDAKKLDLYYGSCLLHELAKQEVEKNTDNFLKKADLLLTAIPDMINSLDRWGQTPIDIAQVSLKTSRNPKVLEQLITLFRNNRGLTAQELKKQTVIKHVDQ